MESQVAKYLLVSFKTCPWVQRAAIVLREKNVDFEFRHIEPDNRPDWFLAISPHKKVPVLRVDDTVSIFESNAIAEYLDETVPPRLHPEDPIVRAVNRAWTDYIPTFSEGVTGCAYADSEADYKKATAEAARGNAQLRSLSLAASGPNVSASLRARISGTVVERNILVGQEVRADAGVREAYLGQVKAEPGHG